MHNELLDEIKIEVEKQTCGELKTDIVHRILYRTDASMYQFEPLAVYFPKRSEDVLGMVSIAARFRVPLIARGAGTSLAGQAIGPGIIIDFSRYLHQNIVIDRDRREAEVDPGVVLHRLNQIAALDNLHFAPDPASADRATVGGSLSNNAAGAHSILYGRAVDHVLSMDVVLADGSTATFNEIGLAEARRKTASHIDSIENRLYAFALKVHERDQEVIRANWPKTWRAASGYNLNYLIPWAPSSPPLWHEVTNLPYPPVSPETINLSHLFVGAEGTLGIILKARLRLFERLGKTNLIVMSFGNVAEACDAVPGLFTLSPFSIELIPRAIVQLAAAVPAYAKQLQVLDELKVDGKVPEALLVMEVPESGSPILAQVRHRSAHGLPVLEVKTSQQKDQIWSIRKVGLGLLMSAKGDAKPWAFIEDLAVPVEALGSFVRDLEEIFREYQVQAEFYAHASAGCLHIRPLINIKSPHGVRALRSISLEAMRLVNAYRGAPSGEHGDGISRSEWLPLIFGEKIYEEFRALKQCADEYNLLNPGKIAVPLEGGEVLRMDEHLRYPHDYQPQAWSSAMYLDDEGGLIGAIEQCNGAGVCRKGDGLMCPSFIVSGDEFLSTRGRANLLRAWLERAKLEREERGALSQALYRTLSSCLGCKGCKAECPSGVDMARLKTIFLEEYYRTRRHPLRDYLFAYLSTWAQMGYRLAPVINHVIEGRGFGRVFKRMLGVSIDRHLPRLVSTPLRRRIAYRYNRDRDQKPLTNTTQPGKKVFLLCDAFTEYFYPEIGLDAIFVLTFLGWEVILMPVVGAGRTFFSKGFVKQARRHANKLLNHLQKVDRAGEGCVVGLEPSEIYMLRDEYQLLINGDNAEFYANLRDRVFTMEDFLVRELPKYPHLTEKLRIAINHNPQNTVFVHTHCHQRSEVPHADGHPYGSAATIALLRMLGFQVEENQGSCCGMAGSFGYEEEHEELSRSIGKRTFASLLEGKAENRAVVVSAGASCRAQIADLGGGDAVHPIQLVARLLNSSGENQLSSKISQ